MKKLNKEYIIEYKTFSGISMYLESHCRVPIFKRGIENAKVFSTMHEVNKFFKFWNRDKEAHIITEANL